MMPPRSGEAADSRHMREAIRLAQRGQGRVEPNPMVGCVIVHHGRVVGRGYHRRFGGPHAEIEALRACRVRPAGATVYVTLEPCAHDGKTPPCTEALIEAGVARVVAAMTDPSPAVAGRGFAALRRAGISVHCGVLGDESTRLLAPYLTCLQLGRPYVIAKWAQSLDGKLATSTGDSQWISNSASRALVHKLRARVDGVLVGSGTVLADNPLLTARGVPILRRARRVVLDSRLRIPIQSRLVQSCRSAPLTVFTSTERAHSTRATRLGRLGVEVVACRRIRRGLSIRSCLKKLAERGTTNVLVEGGPQLLTSFLLGHLADEAWVFTAPRLIGGDRAPSSLLRPAARLLRSAPAPHALEIRRIHDDVLHRLWLIPPPHPGP